MRKWLSFRKFISYLVKEHSYTMKIALRKQILQQFYESERVGYLADLRHQGQLLNRSSPFKFPHL